MSFIAGNGKTNTDILYAGLPRLPEMGEELYSQDFALKLGGGVPGTMINISRLGIPVKVSTWLGNDMFSQFCRQEYKQAGCEVINLYTGSGELPLNITSAMITPEDRTFVTYGPEPKYSDFELEQIYKASTGAKVVEIQNGCLEVYKQLKKEGTILVLDTGYTEDMSFEMYKEYIAIADYYTPNQKEALKITGKETPEQAIEFLSQYFEKPIVKLDKNGCMGMENGKIFTVQSINEFKRVDSTGAGDAFLAGLMYGLFYDYSFRDCITLGNLTGGKCVTGVGCLTEYFKEDELLRKLNEYRG